MRFRDLLKDISKHEQKLENVLLYVDFLEHPLPIILLKDGSLLILFEISGVDYQGLSEDDKQQFSYYSRTALEQLPEEGAGFMLSNLLVRNTPDTIPLKENAEAHPLIQYVHQKKQAFWDKTISESYGNRIFCGLRYFNPKKKEAPWSLLIQESKTFQFYLDQLRKGVERLEQGYHTLASAYARFGFRALDREKAFRCLYELVNFGKPSAYRPDLSLNAQLAHSHYLFRPGEEYALVNDTQYCSLIGMKYPPPGSIAMYLRRFYELDFPLVLRQSLGFCNRQKLHKDQDFNVPIALALSTVSPTNQQYVDEVKQFRNRIENEKELPLLSFQGVALRQPVSD